ncbi:putative serine protease HhoB [Calidithermus terrae]|uniref:Putative serine protease HhoB n=1 Tax=Calidithermus terrae TaxID=1408545 RepID=A0A399EED2_9DEIN|nr:S1C family serine protease [Calidithermus terrae]RIH82268.1 putative serine protease HhoB [Calidithermus terrae]
MRIWLLAVMVGFMGLLATGAQKNDETPVLDARAAKVQLERVYEQVHPAAVRIETRPQGTGSGFFISADGLVLTAYHVIEDTERFWVRTADEKRYPAEVVGYDALRDIALIKAKVPGPVPFMELETAKPVRRSESLMTIGNSRGEFIAPRVGTVTNIGRTIRADFPGDLIASTMPLAPGDSGGPVLNTEGKVVAVAVAIGREQQDGQDVPVFQSYATPLLGLNGLIGQIKAGYRRDIPFMGVSLSQLTDDEARAYGLRQGGVVVLDLIEGYPAATSGLQPPRRLSENRVLADLILEVDGKAVQSSDELIAYVRSRQVGDTITLKVLRGSETVTVKITLTAKWRSS